MTLIPTEALLALQKRETAARIAGDAAMVAAALAVSAKAAAELALIRKDTTKVYEYTRGFSDTVGDVRARLLYAETVQISDNAAVVDQLDLISVNVDNASNAALSAAASIEEYKVVAARYGLAIAQSITKVQASVGDNSASIKTESLARVTADEAEAVLRLAVRADFITADSSLAASVTSEATTRATADSANASNITTVASNLATEVTNRSAAVTTEATTRAAADSAEATLRLAVRSDFVAADTALQGNINTVSSAVTTEATTRATADSTNASNITTVSSSLATEVTNRSSADTTLQTNINTVSSAVTSEASTRATADSTNASNITTVSSSLATEVTNRSSADSTLQTNINTVSSSVTTEASTRATNDGNLSGKYALKVTAGNVVTGMNITSSTGGGTDVSDITFNALNFKIYNGTTAVAPFQVVGGVVKVTGSLVLVPADVTGLAAVATTGAAANISGLAAVATSGTLAAGSVTGLAAVATTGAAANISGLAPVATGGTLGAGSVTGLAAVATTGAAANVSGLAATATNSDFAAVTGATKPANNADVTLSAVNGGLTVTGGGITLSSGGAMKGGASSYGSGTGFFLGYESGQYRFRVGDPAGARIQWDGSAWTVVGLPGGASQAPEPTLTPGGSPSVTISVPSGAPASWYVEYTYGSASVLRANSFPFTLSSGAGTMINITGKASGFLDSNIVSESYNTLTL